MTKSRAGKGAAKHRVVSHKAWIGARRKFLAKEKKFTRLRDELARQRRALPGRRGQAIRVRRTEGQGDAGRAFRRQESAHRLSLHVRAGPGRGLQALLLLGGQFQRPRHPPQSPRRDLRRHLPGPLASSTRSKKRMDWSFKWVSSGRNDFNYDYQASFTPQKSRAGRRSSTIRNPTSGVTDREGVSVFCKDQSGALFHTTRLTRAGSTC